MLAAGTDFDKKSFLLVLASKVNDSTHSMSKCVLQPLSKAVIYDAINTINSASALPVKLAQPMSLLRCLLHKHKQYTWVIHYF